VIFAVLVAVAAAILTASADLSSLSALDVSQVMAGELWRLFSGHLTHLSWRHYAVDAPVFMILYTVYSKQNTPSSAVLLALFAALSVSFSVILVGTHQLYGGLSGLSCAALSAILFSMVREDPKQIQPYFLCLAYGIYLMFMGGISSGVPVAHEAHIAGAFSGLVFAFLLKKVRKEKTKSLLVDSSLL
jgi:rhomboid family GlyGly-CTERM serine protease